MEIVNTAEEALSRSDYKQALCELLYQLGDDDFVFAYRNSEWLGLAPHIEEDVAFSSISQDTMGHASLYYQLLADLGEGVVDAIAHGRQPAQFKNAIILEDKNGSGTYLVEPRYDWAFAVVRNYFYDLNKKIRLDSLKKSSYKPLANIANKIITEQYFHIMHWEVWFTQLMNAGGESRTRMTAAIQTVWDDYLGVISLGSKGEDMVKMGLIESESILKERVLAKLQTIFDKVHFVFPGEPGMKRGDGRSGIHTDELAQAIETLSEVYLLDPTTIW